MSETQAPYLTVKCPKCGRISDIKLIDQIYYPAELPPSGHAVAFECNECDVIIERKINIVSVIATFDVDEQKII